MKQKRYTTEQIIRILRQADSDLLQSISATQSYREIFYVKQYTSESV